MKIGLGVTTYNRPDYLKQCLEGIKNVKDEVDTIWVYNDASTKRYDVDFPDYVQYYKAKKNKGVATAKNWLLKQMIKEGCDYLFLIEDDIIIKSPKAITEYVRLSKLSGIEHFMFAHHGPANKGMLYLRKKGIDLYTACVGAYCMYTKNAIEKAGYFDENFYNAWEHIEHTFRIQKVGLTTPFPTYPDLTESKKYLKEIPRAIKNSSIRHNKDWTMNIVKGLLYWKEIDKQFPFREKLDSLLKEIEEFNGKATNTI